MDTPTKPGIYKKIPFSVYKKIDAVNHSTLSDMDISPKYYLHTREHGLGDTPAMLLGRAIHTLMLEPDLFDTEFAIFEGAVRRGKAWNSFYSENMGKQILTGKQEGLVFAMQKSLLDSRARDLGLFYTESKNIDFELTLIWIDEKTGLKCKCRIDILTNLLNDLKSTSSKTPSEFIRSARKYNYNTQMAFYRRGILANGLQCDGANIIAVQSVELIESFMVEVKNEVLDNADKKIDEWLARVQECQDMNYWPGLDDGDHVYELAPWEKEESKTVELSTEMQKQFNELDWSE